MSRGASRFPARRNACLSLQSPAAGRFSVLSLARRAASWDRQADLAAFDRSGPFVDGVAGLRIRPAPRPYAASYGREFIASRNAECASPLPVKSSNASHIGRPSHAFRSKRATGSAAHVPATTKLRERLRGFLACAQGDARTGCKPRRERLQAAGESKALGSPMRLGSNPSPSQGFATCTNRP